MQKKGFYDVKVNRGDKTKICYRTGMTVYEEVLQDGVFYSTYWNGAGFPSDSCYFGEPFSETPIWMDFQHYARPQSFQLEVNGQLLDCRWRWKNFEQKEMEKGLHCCLELEHETANVTVGVHTLLDGSAILTRWMEVKNTGDVPANLSHIAVMSGAMQTTVETDRLLKNGESLYDVGFMKSSCWANEGDFHWMNLPSGGYTIYGRGRRELHKHPMYLLKNNASGEIFICQFAWSGNYAFEFDLNDELDIRHSRKEFLTHAVIIDTEAPSRVLSPQESAELPAVHIGMMFGSADDAINQMHHHIRKSVMMPQARGRGGWIETSILADEHWTEERIKRKIDQVADLGVEIFFIDACWYTEKGKESEWRYKVGDWDTDPKRFPDHLQRIINYVHEKGMLWGLWMDPERIGWDSNAYQEHLDFHALNIVGKPGPEGWVRAADNNVLMWVEQQIRHVIETYQCDLFRLDFNVNQPDIATRTDRGNAFEQDQLRYYENMYAMWKRLRKDYPNVIFENCAGGGARTDLGMMQNFCHTWVSDWQRAPRSFQIINGMTMALPPELVDREVGEMEGYSRGSLEFQMRIALFGRISFGTLGAPTEYDYNPEQMEIIRHALQIYKEFYRPFQYECLIYHHTQDLGQTGTADYGVLEVTSPDHKKGMIGIFKLKGNGENRLVVKSKGILESGKYHLTFDNRRASCVLEGFVLNNQGIQICLEGALSSELVLYEMV